MKTIINVQCTAIMIAVLIISFSLSSCNKNRGDFTSVKNSGSNIPENLSASAISKMLVAPLKVPVVTVEPGYNAIFFEDENYMPVSDDNTLLWNKNGHIPIMAPNGHQI